MKDQNILQQRGLLAGVMGFFFMLFMINGSVWAKPAGVLSSIRTTQTANKLDIKLHFQSAVPPFRLFQLNHPDRVVLDLFQTQRQQVAAWTPLSFDGITGIRTGIQNGYDVRVVIDLTRFQIPEFRESQHDLILSFMKSAVEEPSVRQVPPTSMIQSKKMKPTQLSAAPQNTKSERAVEALKPTLFKVAIDAGHGGSDPGAVGPQGSREKHITLSIAKKLANLVDRYPGMKAILIRDRDYFVPLRQRMERARRAQADLFVSIHADGFTDPKAHGASVFTLSSRGASTEFGLWLAQKENRSDLIGGVSLSDKDQLLASVLLDLSQTATLDASYELGELVLGQLKDVTFLHKSDVQQAGFAVLKSPDLPSVLIETGFISNPKGELKLNSPDFQRTLASAVFKGILVYHERKHTGTQVPVYASLSTQI